MINRNFKTIFLLLASLLPLVGYTQKISKEALIHSQQADSLRIKAHVKYLADDKLLGRYPGTEGFQMAVDYVIDHYKQAGLLPAGDAGAYTQKLLLRKAKTNVKASQTSMKLPDGSIHDFDLAKELNLYPHPEKPLVQLTNVPLVLVGAGIDAPSLGYDHFANVDLHGKIVLVLSRMPDVPNTNIKRHLSYPTTLANVAVKRGAIGALVCSPYVSVANFLRGLQIIQKDGVNKVLTPNGTRNIESGVMAKDFDFSASLSPTVLNKIIKAEGLNLEELWKKIEKGENVSRSLQTTISANYGSTYTDCISYNVLGVLPGSSPKLAKEYVVHSGHLDHLGTTTPIEGDSICNGAHDNASGVASLLEIVRLYGSLKQKPKRSILFNIVTAEEWGLLGSEYFVKNPTVPINSIVADINTDMPTIIAPLQSVAPLGAEHSTMWNYVAKAAKALDLKVEVDPDPSEGRFVRSDQYNFLRVGIPAIHIKYGYKYADPSLNLFEKVKMFRENHYHKPSDNFNESFVWSAGAKYVQVNFLVSHAVAQNKKRPKFNKGDFFGLKQ
jgi:hypothetical protein